MIRPQYLKKGDKIGIISPAGFVNIANIEYSIKIIENWGLKVVLGKNIYNKSGIYAGNDIERASDLQMFINDNSIKAILFSRGGYGSVRIFDKVNFSNLIYNPKWLIGFSDITVFHSIANKILKIETIHSAMPVNFRDNVSVEYLRKAIFGEHVSYKVISNKHNIVGNCKAQVVGGNLSVLYSLKGTKLEINTKNQILFIEDIGEYYYHLDRMLMNFKISGTFNNIKGLIVGAMNEMKDGNSIYEKNAYQIISEFVSELNIPVCFDFPAGHIEKNYPIFLGRKINLNVCKDFSEIRY